MMKIIVNCSSNGKSHYSRYTGIQIFFLKQKQKTQVTPIVRLYRNSNFVCVGVWTGFIFPKVLILRNWEYRLLTGFLGTKGEGLTFLYLMEILTLGPVVELELIFE